VSDTDLEPLVCAHCGSEDVDLGELDRSDASEGDEIDCLECGETNYVWNDALVDENDYHEYSCESAAASRDEERSHGGRDDDFSPESFRPEF
jgi:hypothetical protein